MAGHVGRFCRHLSGWKGTESGSLGEDQKEWKEVRCGIAGSMLLLWPCFQISMWRLVATTLGDSFGEWGPERNRGGAVSRGHPYPRIIQETKERQAATFNSFVPVCVLQGADFTAPGGGLCGIPDERQQGVQIPPGWAFQGSTLLSLGSLHPPRNCKTLPI